MKSTAQAAVVIALIAVSAVGIGYAYVLYASDYGEDVDGHYIIIKGLDPGHAIDYDVDFDAHGGTAGQPIATSTINDGSKLIYEARTNVPGDYYLQLVSYALHLDDGTVVKGTVGASGVTTFDDLSHSTVVTSTSMGLTLDNIKIPNDNRIRFTLTGSAISDGGIPVSSGSPAPAMPAYISTVDVTIKLIEDVTQSMSVEMDATSVSAGETSASTVTVKNSGVQVYGYTVGWASSNTSVATVSDTGVIKGVNGSDSAVTITASVDNGSGGTASATDTIYVVSVEVSRYVSIAVGGTFTPSPTVHPSDASVEWTKVSGDTSVSVDAATGQIIVAASASPGDVAVLSVTATYDGASASQLCLVSVLQPTVVLDRSSIILLEGGQDGTLTATVNPAGSAVTWDSSDETVVTVSDGTVHPVAIGSATVTATITVGGHDYSAKCLVTVSDPSDQAVIYVKWVTPSNGLVPEGLISLAGATRISGDVVIVAQGDISSQILSSSYLFDQFALVEHGEDEPVDGFISLSDQKVLSIIGVEEDHMYDLYLKGYQAEVHVSYRNGHAPAGTITIGAVTVSGSGSVYVYHSAKTTTVVSSTINTDKYSVDGGANYTQFGDTTVYVGERTDFIFSDST